MRPSAFAASCLLLGAARLAVAQDSVGQQLNAAEARLGTSGYHASHGRVRGALRQGQQAAYPVGLTQGRRYVVVAVCDTRCTDLDLRIEDDAGALVAEDTASDDTPLVPVAPRWSGRFRVAVRMHACAPGPCTFGLTVLSQ